MMRSAESTISDLVPLLYRARWLRFSLSGEVRSRRKRGGDGGHDELSGSLLASPGGLYRADLVDEEGEREQRICDGHPGSVPFAELLIPSWLLADFDLKSSAGRTTSAATPMPYLANPARQAQKQDPASVPTPSLAYCCDTRNPAPGGRRRLQNSPA
jgi:hypothetical protein